MTIILARLDLEQIYCDVDDFYQIWERYIEFLPQLPYEDKRMSEKYVVKLNA